MSKLSDEQRKKLKEYVKEHPEDTHKDFMKKCKGVKISDAYYYMVRRDVNGPSRNSSGPKTHRKPKGLYLTVWSHPSEKVSADCKAILIDFLTTLNDSTRGRFELIELKDPAQIEIREATR
jgi:hypothetical protein